MKDTEADKERKKKLSMSRVHGCMLCKQVKKTTLHRYKDGYICQECWAGDAIDDRERAKRISEARR